MKRHLNLCIVKTFYFANYHASVTMHRYADLALLEKIMNYICYGADHNKSETRQCTQSHKYYPLSCFLCSLKCSDISACNLHLSLF